ncbi:MAG: SMC-Scp complex subunit ScpB [Bifidobacteriaceae bacterium]|jgi:segregation and condensation protein B|nr:SMC-Scp complex subunit ScpB [Bifidobacteriaceae bacterium]MCI1914219.1 SMC-Scp complex subunit ScpB [Bifidobacteriaceae bacterium]
MSDERGDTAGAPGTDGASDSADYADFSVDDFPGGLQGCLEALLMSAEDPLTAAEVARVLDVEPADVTASLERMQAQYAQERRGFELVSSVRGWRFMSGAEYEPVVAAFVTDKQNNRLSQAALEALAIIAYKQPMTRAQVSSIRGVNSDGVIRSLMLRGFVTEMGEEAESHARVLATTDIFLEKLGISALTELPPLAPFLPRQDEAMEDSGIDDSGDDTSDTVADDTVVNSARGPRPFNQFIDKLAGDGDRPDLV